MMPARGKGRPGSSKAPSFEILSQHQKVNAMINRLCTALGVRKHTSAHPPRPLLRLNGRAVAVAALLMASDAAATTPSTPDYALWTAASEDIVEIRATQSCQPCLPCWIDKTPSTPRTAS